MALVAYTVIHAVTREDYDTIMEWADRKGYRWYGCKDTPTQYDAYQPNVGISIEEGEQIAHSPISWFFSNKNYTVISMQEFYDLTGGISLPFTGIPTLWPW